MYPTMRLTVSELLHQMREMKVGEEIGLCQTPNGDYSYGIRRLPGAMFDNDACWIADYYGGGSTAAFSETEGEHICEPEKLANKITDWLDDEDLLITHDECGDPITPSVYVQVKGSLPETKWEFKEIRQQNRIACVNFDLKRPYRAYISVPPDASDDEITTIAVKKLCALTHEDFCQYVISCEDDCEPFIGEGDVTWMEVDTEWDRYRKETTDKPTGTLIL